MTGPQGLTAVVCTRDRPGRAAATLDALVAQQGEPLDVVVVDQSRRPDPELARRAAEDARLTLVRDENAGLSRARNLGVRHCRAEWIAFVDDDCVPAPDWAERLRQALSRHPEAEMASGQVDAGSARADGVAVADFHVERTAVRRGRFCHPGRLGPGVCMAVRRVTVERLGGWDERLGAGVPRFPSSEDMDFNYRLLRSGGAGLVVREARATHDQWRSPSELGAHLRGYARGWCGFAMKHLKGGDPVGGAWLWLIGLIDALDMLDSAVRRRSRLRLGLAGAKARGIAEGTVAGLLAPW